MKKEKEKGFCYLSVLLQIIAAIKESRGVATIDPAITKIAKVIMPPITKLELPRIIRIMTTKKGVTRMINPTSTKKPATMIINLATTETRSTRIIDLAMTKKGSQGSFVNPTISKIWSQGSSIPQSQSKRLTP